jgi:hypothetical protein
MPLSAVQCKVRIPSWARDAIAAAGAAKPPLHVEAMIASYAAQEAPVILEVYFPDARPWRGGDPVYDKIYRLLPAPSDTNEPVQIRSLGGRLWAPFSPVAGDDPYTIRTGRGRRHDLGSLLDWCAVPGLTRLNPFLELPQQPASARGQSAELDILEFLTGPTVADRALRRAHEDVAIIDHIVHVAVHEPAWRFDSIPDGPAGRRAVARICIPMVEAFEARLRVRLDRTAETSALFQKLLKRSPRQLPREIEFFGQARTVAHDFRYRRDDQRLVALDTARIMAASTDAISPKLPDGALIARSVLMTLHADHSATAAELYRACDQFASELGQTSGASGALRVHKQMQLRQQTWANLEREGRWE